jgi:hypothetical protein
MSKLVRQRWLLSMLAVDFVQCTVGDLYDKSG